MSLLSVPQTSGARPFHVTVSGAVSTVTVTAVGEVDTVTAPELRRAVESALAGSPADELVIDLRAVTFLDSAGLCALANVHRSASAAGVRTRLLCATSTVVRVLRITGLWDVLGAEHAAA